MAAAVQIETVNITINDIEIAVPKGELIVEAVKRLGLEIPIFCYHPRMKPVGMCRMCIVEVGFKQPDGTVRKMPKPQAACTLPASEGMAVSTETERVSWNSSSLTTRWTVRSATAVASAPFRTTHFSTARPLPATWN